MEELPSRHTILPCLTSGKKTHMTKLLQGLVNDHISENKYKQEIIHFGKKKKSVSI